jgi:hypothetical protein
MFCGGVHGVDKLPFFRSEKYIFENSADCRIFKNNFLESEKTLF